jgi:hypothetical protein
LYLIIFVSSLRKFKTNIMKTTTLTLIWDYEDDDRENNIRGGWVLIDTTNGNKQVHLSAKLEELLNEELNPDNF